MVSEVDVRPRRINRTIQRLEDTPHGGRTAEIDSGARDERCAALISGGRLLAGCPEWTITGRNIRVRDRWFGIPASAVSPFL